VNAVRARDTIVRREGPAELRLQLKFLGGPEGTGCRQCFPKRCRYHCVEAGVRQPDDMPSAECVLKLTHRLPMNPPPTPRISRAPTFGGGPWHRIGNHPLRGSTRASCRGSGRAGTRVRLMGCLEGARIRRLELPVGLARHSSRAQYQRQRRDGKR
jgi:hypothetical protein